MAKNMTIKSTQRSSSSESTLSTLHRTASCADLGIDPEKAHCKSASFAVTIRAFLQNWRQGTVGCKDRSEVNFANRKPWKQKGTGRARAGSARSPLWRKGGITFGPQPRVRSLKISEQMRSKVCAELLRQKLNENAIYIVEYQFNEERPRTAAISTLLHQIGVANHRQLLCILQRNNPLLHASLINIPNVHITFFDQLNAFELATASSVIVFKDDFETFKQAVSTWI